MSKIDDLKNEVKSLVALVECAEGNVQLFVGRLTEKRKQIAALEEAESKPREWRMYLDQYGGLLESPISFYWGSYVHEGHLTNTPITVIEKKPLVITKAMELNAYVAGYNAQGNWGPIAYLKALGIDAAMADE